MATRAGEPTLLLLSLGAHHNLDERTARSSRHSPMMSCRAADGTASIK
jgi:hypothetical protein